MTIGRRGVTKCPKIYGLGEMGVIFNVFGGGGRYPPLIQMGIEASVHIDDKSWRIWAYGCWVIVLRSFDGRRTK